MNREYLYKAKRANWRELPKEEWWVEGDLIHEPYGMVIQYYEDEIKGKGSCAKASQKKRIKVVVDPETVCEYTGLPDKNKRKIFEWDCLGHKLNAVEYMNGKFTINGDRDLSLFASNSEVVGNVFDNKYLKE